MELSNRHARLWLGAVFATFAALLLFRLSSFGIWDPWELKVADDARLLLEGRSATQTEAPLGTWLVSLGFRIFGEREWAGRMPGALVGLATLGLAYWMFARFAGRRAGLYAAIVAGTTPLFLFNSRQMMGDASGFAAQALIALAAASAIFRPKSLLVKDERVGTVLFLVLFKVGVWIAIMAQGALLGVLPPLLGVASAVVLDGSLLRTKDKRRCLASWFVVLSAVAYTLAVALAVWADAADYSSLLGGSPRRGVPPTFEETIEDLFHALAPWCAVLPIAVGALFKSAAAGDSGAKGAADVDEEPALRPLLAVWGAVAYGALVLFNARYGVGTYAALVPLAGAVGLLVRDAERDREAHWPFAIVVALFVGLLFRDYVLYPSSPVDALSITDVSYPEAFNPKVAWGVLLGVFGGLAGLGFAVAPSDASWNSLATSYVTAPYKLIRRQWRRGTEYRAWLIAGATLVGLLILFGLTCIVLGATAGDGPPALPTVVLRWGMRLLVLPIVIPIAIALVQLMFVVFAKLGPNRFLPMLGAGLLCAAYASQGYLPALSSHFSPREVYDIYNAHARGAPLGEFHVGGRAAAYYSQGDIRELASQNELIEFLVEDELRWGTFPTAELPTIDRAFRQRTHRHLFVADGHSSRVVLVANRPVRGLEDQNFLARYVLSEPPRRMDVRVGCHFEDKLVLLGYDLQLPHEGYVGAGERFTITWYYQVLSRIPGSYKIFVHVDGHGQRLNGDHDPVDEKYPPRLWDPGDVIVDRQELSVPSNYRPGDYTIFLGFFSGNTRLDVTEGPHDNDKRARAGVLSVR